MDQTEDAACCEKQVEEEAVKYRRSCSDPNSSFSNGPMKSQPRIQVGFSRFEWLGFIIMALATFWLCGLPPSDPMDWLQWLFNVNGRWTTPARATLLFMAFLLFLISRSYKRQMNSDVYSGSVKVRGVSILGFNLEASAGKAGMLKGDVIIEYDSERDLTLEKLSAVLAKRGAEEGQVCVVFIRDGQQYSEMLPSGSLGISAMNTTINVPVRSE